MTPAEFENEYMPVFLRCFPGVAKWLDTAPEGTLIGWMDCLEDTCVTDCLAVLKMMNRGTLAQPRGFGDFARRVRTCVLERKSMEAVVGPRHANGDHKCSSCRDTGMREIYHPQAVRRVLNGEEPTRSHVRTAIAGCPCGAAKSLNLPLFKEGPYVFLWPQRGESCDRIDSLMIEFDPALSTDGHLEVLRGVMSEPTF